VQRAAEVTRRVCVDRNRRGDLHNLAAIIMTMSIYSHAYDGDPRMEALVERLYGSSETTTVMMHRPVEPMERRGMSRAEGHCRAGDR
jgi:hypothetical protein